MSQPTPPIPDDFMHNHECAPQTQSSHSSTASLKSSLKSSKSSRSTNTSRSASPPPTVRFAVEPGVESESKIESRESRQDMHVQTPAAPPRDVPVLLPSKTRTLRKRLSKRFSAPEPVGQKGTNVDSTRPPPVPLHRNFSLPTSSSSPLVASRVSSTYSAKSLPTTRTSTIVHPPLQHQAPSQYNPLQNYIPCLFSSCKTHYLRTHLGPTFYLPQEPYKLVRNRGLCPTHASRDLKLANDQCKRQFEFLRQNAGRKTLGLIAAEFEIWVQKFREDRAEQSQRNEQLLWERLLDSSSVDGKGGKSVSVSKAKGKVSQEQQQQWDWKYVPRPCTKKGCQNDWYSVFDARLYLFYHTARRSGFQPLTTLCPSCAKLNLSDLEFQLESKGAEMGEEQWRDWLDHVKRDREAEQTFWEHAQQRVVGEKRVGYRASESKKEKDTEGAGTESKEMCVVM